MPKAGDECFVMLDNRMDPWIIAWWTGKIPAWPDPGNFRSIFLNRVEHDGNPIYGITLYPKAGNIGVLQLEATQWPYLIVQPRPGSGMSGAGIGVYPTDVDATAGWELYADAGPRAFAAGPPLKVYDSIHGYDAIYLGTADGLKGGKIGLAAGPGDPGGTDVYIYRPASNIIRTDNIFDAVAGLRKNGQGVVAAGDTAGGALSGTFPNPSLAPGTVVAIGSAAGGALAGTYPNPSLAAGAVSGAAIPDASIEGRKLSTHVGTSPPASPSAGDLWIMPFAGCYWQFMYDPTEPTYKWKFIGGAPFAVQDTTDVGTSAPTVQWIAIQQAAGQTIPRNGVYVVEYGDSAGISGMTPTGMNVFWDTYFGNGTTTYGEPMYTRFYVGGTGAHIYSRYGTQTLTLTAGMLPQFYYAVNNWDVISYSRELSITPVKVS
jgi:hypothetical protein